MVIKKVVDNWEESCKRLNTSKDQDEAVKRGPLQQIVYSICYAIDFISTIYNKENRHKPHLAKDLLEASAWIIGIFAVVVIFIVIALAPPSNSKNGYSTDTNEYNTTVDNPEILAWVMAQEFVKRDMKNPGGASFGSVWNGDYQRPNEVVTCLGGKSYQISAWVDGTNGFGATVRTNFECQITNTTGETWICDYLMFDE